MSHQEAKQTRHFIARKVVISTPDMLSCRTKVCQELGCFPDTLECIRPAKGFRGLVVALLESALALSV
ncbi:Uncharacterized protein DAT39_013061, partial [Clarias magur]